MLSDSAGQPSRIPFFVNPDSGSADVAEQAVEAEPRLELREVKPDELTGEITRAARSGAKCIAIAGGDGTVAMAAAALADSEVALVIIPAGTLNHFARDLGIPLEPAAAAALVSQGVECRVDLGAVGDRIFINTSSVGAYVAFVRTRERLERRWGYFLASALAAARTLPRMPRFRVEIELDGEDAREYVSSLIFLGVDERELRVPTLGNRIEGGERGLHVLVVHGRTRARLVMLGFTAVLRGLHAVTRGKDVESFMVERCTIHAPRIAGRLSVDGEIVNGSTPLEYSLRRDALRVLVPAATAAR
jgi:diacylglycerol kinase family enzyme